MTELTDDQIEAFSLTILGIRKYYEVDLHDGREQRMLLAEQVLRSIAESYLDFHPSEEQMVRRVTKLLGCSAMGRLVEMGYDEMKVRRYLLNRSSSIIAFLARICIQPERFVIEEAAWDGLHPIPRDEEAPCPTPRSS
jgi:hypothetical protein